MSDCNYALQHCACNYLPNPCAVPSGLHRSCALYRIHIMGFKLLLVILALGLEPYNTYGCLHDCTASSCSPGAAPLVLPPWCCSPGAAPPGAAALVLLPWCCPPGVSISLSFGLTPLPLSRCISVSDGSGGRIAMLAFLRDAALLLCFVLAALLVWTRSVFLKGRRTLFLRLVLVSW